MILGRMVNEEAQKPGSLVLGIILIVIGIIILLLSASPSSLILILIGGALCYLGWQGQ